MVTGEETARALEGVYRIAVFDRAGVSGFGKDLRACARSFWAYVIALPAILLWIGVTVVVGGSDTPLVFAAAHIVAHLVQIAGFPLLMLPILRRLARADRWAWFITGYNWLTMARSIAVVSFLGLLLGMPGIDLGLWGVRIYFIVLEAFLAESILKIGAWRAGAIVVLDTAIYFGLDALADWIGGLS